MRIRALVLVEQPIRFETMLISGMEISDRAIYTVTIPAPGAAGLALFAALATSSARRRRPHPR